MSKIKKITLYLLSTTIQFIMMVALVLAVALPPTAHAEDGKKFRLLVLASQMGNPYNEVRTAMLETLAAAGYRQGENLEVTIVSCNNSVALAETLLYRELPKKYESYFQTCTDGNRGKW